ncbi:unnamed protein product [Adineta steineri]|uniref:Uncharacterized protein n=1 Tax=Adineta steineri TaxID=433720 RepID=A0A816FWB4_9BILA|nr:unnamed protein product [Adineta steineri]CAF1666982.1 unnamed protein product [Adineta steineri]
MVVIPFVFVFICIWFGKNDYRTLVLNSIISTATNTKDFELSVQTFRQRKCTVSHTIRSNVSCKQVITDFRPYLVIPIHRGHFGDASRFFQTFIANVVDLERIDIQVVLSDDQEARDFMARLQQDNVLFEKINIHFWSFPRLLQSFGIKLYQDWGVFSHKLPYLSLKKLAALYVSKQWQYALILDCEVVIRRKTNFTEVFLDFFISPYMFYENATIHRWMTDGSRTAVRIPDSVLPSRDTFVGQYHGWFLERDIFDKFMNHVLYNSTDLLRWAHSVPHFSNEHMYSYWLLWNRNGMASHYTFIDIPELLKTFLSAELMKRFYPAWNTRHAPQGTFECIYCWATPEIVDLLNPFFMAYKLTFYDYHADHSNKVGDCTLIRLLNTVPTMGIQVTSQWDAKGTWDQLECSKVYRGAS